MPACPVGLADRTGVVIFFTCLDLEQKSSFMDGHYINWNQLNKQSVESAIKN
jgi:hypothetical protein